MTDATLQSALALGGYAFVIGFTGAMAPGPLLTVAITEACRRGYRALLLIAGHAMLEAALLVGFAFGLQKVLSLPALTRALALVGGAFLVWMGADLLLGAVRGSLRLPETAGATPSDTRANRFGPLLAGVFVSLSNPYWALWWLTIGLKLAMDGIALGPAGVASFFIGHELADLVWYGVVIAAVASGRHLLSDRLYRGIIGTCAAFLVVLGAGFVLSGIRGLG